MSFYPLGSHPMTKWANRLLWTTALLYGLVFIGSFFVESLWYEGLYWVIQSALIGSIADWFAVTALFKKPLGFPYHTALLPRHKEKLIQTVVHLVESKLLSKEQCQDWVNRISFTSYIDHYVKEEKNRLALRLFFTKVLVYLYESKSREEWAQWGGKKIETYLLSLSLLSPLRTLWHGIARHNEHEEMVCRLLGALQEGLQTSAAEQWLTEVIEEEIEKRKERSFTQALLLSFTESMNIINAHDMAVAMLSEMQLLLERWKEKGSRERLYWLREWEEPLERFFQEPSVKMTVTFEWEQWVSQQSWPELLSTYVLPLLEETLLVEDGSPSSPSVILEEGLYRLWREQGEGEKSRLEGLMKRGVLAIIEECHPLIGKVVHYVLDNFSTDTFITFVWTKIEGDLSWIRINGAIVGAICGFLVWGFLTGLYSPLLQLFLP